MSTGAGGEGGTDAQGCGLGWKGDILVGTPRGDEILAITSDPQGNLYVAGYEAGVLGVENVEPVGDARAFVSRYSPGGSLLWKQYIDTPAADVAEDIVLNLSTREIYVTGRTSGALEGFTNQGQYDIFVAILDMDIGSSLHRFQAGNERPQHPKRMALDATGAVIIAGYDDVYVPTNYVESWDDPFVVRMSSKIDSGGQRELSIDWWYQYQTEHSDYVIGVAADTGGDIFVGGVHAVWPGDVGAVVRKLGVDGATGWIQHISTPPDDVTYAVALSPSGDLYVTGATFLKLGAESFGQQDAFVAKIDKDTGGVLWITQAGWETSEFPTALAFDAAGNIHVAGSTWLGADTDLFAMKLSPSGALLETWRHGTPANDDIWDAEVDPCGRLFVVGSTEGELVTSTLGSGGRDGFILEVDLQKAEATP